MKYTLVLIRLVFCIEAIVTPNWNKVYKKILNLVPTIKMMIYKNIENAKGSLLPHI